MPTVLRKEGFRFFFYSNDHEPVHIHVEKEDHTAKFLLEPVQLIRSKGFNANEISNIRKLVIQEQHNFKQYWNEYFNNK